jgi:hypothetical protein
MAKLWDASSQYGFIEAVINILSTVTEGFQIQVRQLTGTAGRNFPVGCLMFLIGSVALSRAQWCRVTDCSQFTSSWRLTRSTGFLDSIIENAVGGSTVKDASPVLASL